MRASGIAVKAVHIDGSDLGEHARRVRAILDSAGLQSIGIFASGNLDEYRVRDLIAADAPIDGFGVGNTSANTSYLDCAYKLTECPPPCVRWSRRHPIRSSSALLCGTWRALPMR